MAHYFNPYLFVEIGFWLSCMYIKSGFETMFGTEPIKKKGAENGALF